MDPGLSPTEETRWNRYADLMSQFHNHFKNHFSMLHRLADGTYSRYGMTLSTYLEFAIQFKQMLTLHHIIEDREIFPKLATRMPQFSADSDGHVKAHRDIDKGLEKLSSLIEKWKSNPKTYSPAEMRKCLDELQPVLFRHMDDEVSDLKGESLRRYFSSIDELERQLPGRFY